MSALRPKRLIISRKAIQRIDSILIFMLSVFFFCDLAASTFFEVTLVRPNLNSIFLALIGLRYYLVVILNFISFICQRILMEMRDRVTSTFLASLDKSGLCVLGVVISALIDPWTRELF